MAEEPRTLYYALGGGLGHATRALALARQSARTSGGQHRILVNSSFAATLQPEVLRIPNAQLIRMIPDVSPAAAGESVRAQLAQFRPHTLIVDTFPRGLGGELVEIVRSAPVERRVLVARRLSERYVEEYRLREFAGENYDLILIPGEPSPFQDLYQAHFLPPFLIRDADELLSPRHAREILSSPERVPVILLVGSGTEQECREIADIALRLDELFEPSEAVIRLALPEEVNCPARLPGCCPVRHYPLVECLSAVSVVIGQGGYNLVHEVRHCGVPHLLIARRRKYDSQTRRHCEYTQVPDAASLTHRVRSILAQPAVSPQEVSNGARLAAELIHRQSSLSAV